jgi:hypothetical protein
MDVPDHILESQAGHIGKMVGYRIATVLIFYRDLHRGPLLWTTSVTQVMLTKVLTTGMPSQSSVCILLISVNISDLCWQGSGCGINKRWKIRLLFCSRRGGWFRWSVYIGIKNLHLKRVKLWKSELNFVQLLIIYLRTLAIRGPRYEQIDSQYSPRLKKLTYAFI